MYQNALTAPQMSLGSVKSLGLLTDGAQQHIEVQNQTIVSEFNTGSDDNTQSSGRQRYQAVESPKIMR